MKHAISPTRRAYHTEPSQFTQRMIGMRTIADAARTPKSRHLAGSAARGDRFSILLKGLHPYAAEASVAGHITLDRALKRFPSEIRPVLVDDDELRISALPQQKIREPFLAAGADEQIRVRYVSGIHMGGKNVGRNLGGIQIPAHTCFGESARGACNLLPAAIIERNDEPHAGILAGQLFALLQKRNDVGFQIAALAYHLNANACGMEISDVSADEAAKDVEQIIYFIPRPGPVFRAERKDGEILDTEVSGRPNCPAQRLDPLAMARAARKHSLLRPAAIAIHDQGHVPGKSSLLLAPA